MLYRFMTASLLSIAVLMPVAAGPAEATFPGRNGLLAVGGSAFGSRDKCYQQALYTLDPNGIAKPRLRRLGQCRRRDDTHGRAVPDWSADGRQLAFLEWTPFRVGLMSGDGQEVRSVLRMSPRANVPWPFGGLFESRWTNASPPSLAPDGQRVAFTALKRREDVYIWMAAVDGSWARRLFVGSNPRFAPDGRTLAFATFRRDLALLDVESERVLRTVDVPGLEGPIDWSPDGRRLLVVTRRPGRELAVVPADSIGPIETIPLPRRVRLRWHVASAVWSPDRRRIAFIAFREGAPPDHWQQSLWVMRADGRHVRRLYTGSDRADAFWPSSVSWQPVPD